VIAPFVDVDWLKQHQDEVVLADVRWYLDGRSGRAAYEEGHIPGAVFVDLDAVLAAPHADDSHGRHPLPTAERFADGLGQLGIGDGDTVIAYDDDGGAIAARLVWMLRAIGHEAALLSGGINAWPAEDLHPAYPRPRPPATFTAVAWPPERLADIDEVASTDAVVIDSRDRGRFAGGPDPVDPRSGHIPGARNVPTREHLDPDKRIATPEQLRATFAQAGIEQGTRVISYCGAGVTACHNLLALEHAGLGEGRLYPGSWSEWSRDPARPIETESVS
jgi:thiosulfate/3-mercaptopyruvate sulfurtransferase